MSEIPDQNTLINNTLALNLALQTIKERCLHLQKRLVALESENSKLRLTQTSDKKNDNSLSEIEELRAKNAELTTQKNQLSENLSMISTENRKLWKRLSQLTKDGNPSDDPQQAEASTSGLANLKANQNLIRSRTFTQNSPHQLLKEKLIGHQIGPEEDDLEDISLLNELDFNAEKINFGLDDNESCDVDSKACVDGLASIKKELMKQNSDLKVALSNCRKLKAIETCSCKSKPAITKPAMIDKNVNTDVELTIELDYEGDLPDSNNKHDVMIIEQKKVADLNEKICPMCGKFYSTNILFEEFQDHVESHFRDDDIESSHSLDTNFELVSHSVGNF